MDPESRPAIAAVNDLFSKSPNGLREIVRAVTQAMLDAEMTDALRAEKGKRPFDELFNHPGDGGRIILCRPPAEGRARPGNDRSTD